MWHNIKDITPQNKQEVFSAEEIKKRYPIMENKNPKNRRLRNLPFKKDIDRSLNRNNQPQITTGYYKIKLFVF